MRRSRDSVDREIAAWKDATKDTTTRTLWSAAVRTSATRKGAPAEAFKTERVRQILHRAFTHGEPVWMAAEEIAFVAKAMARPLMPEPRETLRRAVGARYRRDRSRKPAGGSMTFDEAKQLRARLQADVKKFEDVLLTFPTGPSGLVPEHIRTSTVYRTAQAEFDQAFSKLRDFNAQFTKTFKLELKAERRSPRHTRDRSRKPSAQSRAKAERAGVQRRFASGVMVESIERNLSEAWDDLRAADRALERGEPEARRRKDRAARELQQAIADARRHGFDTTRWEDRLHGMLA